MDRRALLRQAMQAASEMRDALDLDPFGPIDPYFAAEKLGVKVVFLGNSMEGFYFKGPPARILLSSLRPVPRRAFTCAHELGHHWFGHGSTIEQLQEDERLDSDKPEEVLANGFAGFFLMPTPGLRGAFAKRGWTIAAVTPLQLFIVACEFGVGYRTVLNHLSYALNEIGAHRRRELERWTPQRIRRQILEDEYDSAIAVDGHNEAPTFDVETGAAVLLPLGATTDSLALEHVRSLDNFELFNAVRRGRATISDVGNPCEVRVMPKLIENRPYEGPAANRFLEDPDEDE